MPAPLRKRVVIRVPSSTANLGPGYDVLGMAVRLWLEADVSLSDQFHLTIEGAGASVIPTTQDNLLVKCTRKAFEIAGVWMPPMSFKIRNQIPFCCGCGSSSSAVVAGLLVGFAMTSHPHTSHDLMQLATAIEGHPDNASAAVFGGIRIGMIVDSVYKTIPLRAPPLHCVMFVPAKVMKPDTHEMRRLVPAKVSIEDAAHNMSRTAVVATALSTSQLHLLRYCTEDKFHQNQRGKFYPHMKPAIDAAMQAGACFAFLSGAGATICAFVERKSDDSPGATRTEATCGKVAQAMVQAAEGAGILGDAILTEPSELGAHVLFTVPAMEIKLTVLGSSKL